METKIKTLVTGRSFVRTTGINDIIYENVIELTPIDCDKTLMMPLGHTPFIIRTFNKEFADQFKLDKEVCLTLTLSE